MANGNGNGFADRIAALEAKIAEATEGGWMSDVQRALALILVGSVAFMIATFTLRIAWSGDLPTIAALIKELKDALVNMSLIALGFFFGSSLSKRNADAGQQKMVERLMTGPSSGTGGGAPTAPAIVAAATAAAVEAVKTAAPAAAAEAAPPAAAVAAPPAVDAELNRRGITDTEKPKEPT